MSEWILFLACLAMCSRIFLFERKGSRHRPLVALLAWLAIVASGSLALRLALGSCPFIVTPFIAYTAVLCTLLVFGVHGNLAHIFKLEAHEQHR